MEVYVKKLITFLCIAVIITGTVSAQAIREQQEATASRANAPRAAAPRDASPRNTAPGNNRQRQANVVKVEGTLKLQNGFVALESGESVLYVPMLTRYIGFISGLKEGARVSVEGQRFRNSIQPTKVTIDGKQYDFPAQNRSPAYGNQSFNRRQDNARLGQNNRNAPNRHNHSHGKRNNNSRSGCCCR